MRGKLANLQSLLPSVYTQELLCLRWRRIMCCSWMQSQPPLQA